MKTHYRILIVGGGNAGLSVASKLLLQDPTLEIGIIEPSEKHYYQPAWTLVGSGQFNILDTVKDEKDFMPSKATWILETVSEFSPNTNEVMTLSGKTFTYEAMVVCPGIQIDWDKIQGFKDTLGKHFVSSNYSFNHAPYTWEMIQNMTSGVAVFTNPSTPIKCGGAPHKIMYLACDYWRKKGVLKNISVHYVSGGGVLFGVKEYLATLQDVVQKNQIITHFGANTTRIDGENQVLYYTKTEADGSIKEHSMKFNFLHAVAPQSAPEFIKSSPLRDQSNPHGYINIDKSTMQHVEFKNIFALGDATNAPCSKTGAAIRKQSPVVVENLLSFLNHQSPKAVYTGYSACPIPTQYGKLMLAEFDYTNTPTMTFPFNQAKPRWSMWILKKYILPWLYWNKILKGKA